MKKIILLFILALMTIALVGCDEKTKEVTKGGVTITLPTTFKETETGYAQVYYLSSNAMFMANKFYKNNYQPSVRHSAQTLADYMRYDNNLKYNGESASYSRVETADDGSEFAYLYYDNTVQNIEYTYMLVTKVSDTYCYIMNFASLKTDFEKFKGYFLKYAKTIRVI